MYYFSKEVRDCIYELKELKETLNFCQRAKCLPPDVISETFEKIVNVEFDTQQKIDVCQSRLDHFMKKDVLCHIKPLGLWELTNKMQNVPKKLFQKEKPKSWEKPRLWKQEHNEINSFNYFMGCFGRVS